MSKKYGPAKTELGDIMIDCNGGFDAKNTAEAIFFFDKLFNSVNGSVDEVNKNLYRCPVTKVSIHSTFWKEAKEKLQRMAFVDPKSLLPVSVVKTMKNWKFTLEGFEKL